MASPPTTRQRTPKRCSRRMNSTTSAENADSFIFGDGIPEDRVLATDRLALSTSAPHTRVALVSFADTARSPKPGLHEDSGSCAQLFPSLLIYSGHTVEARTNSGKSQPNTFTFPISILKRVELLSGWVGPA